MSGLGLIVPLSATGNVLSGTPGYSFWAADFNQDRKVSFADYLILERNFGHSGMTNAQGDATGDGKVMYADYQLLESQFGNFGMENSWKGPGNVERANFVFGSMPVPEPASLSLLAAGGLAMIRWRR
jgi:hypothetical protein